MRTWSVFAPFARLQREEEKERLSIDKKVEGRRTRRREEKRRIGRRWRMQELLCVGVGAGVKVKVEIEVHCDLQGG